MSNWAKLLWDTLVTISLVVIVVALIIEFLMHPSPRTLEIVHAIDTVALVFLFVDLLHEFYLAEDKKNFVTREWLLIISFLPFGTIFRLGSIFRASRVVKAVSSVWASFLKLIRLEGVGVKAAQSAVHATKLSKLLRPVAQFMSKKDKQMQEMRGRK